ncbi:BRI1 kinase inhibitor 1-like [Bidens hawaiensis]|uniref:BRI1 kinase inhibitor 1-like n=1 Tax=Bidens hawaiensis TaxID=980011 RepID=UPI0040493253
MSHKVDNEQRHLKQQSTPPQDLPSPPPTTTTSPPSASSSPSHEFSFTTQHHTLFNNSNNKTNTNATLQPPPPPAAIDLSPADDIFFRGHLLPLHHLPDSPRSSNNSLDSFTLPINLLFGNTSFHCHHETILSDSDEPDITTINPNRQKSKSFSIFKTPKWNKTSDNDMQTDEHQVKDKNISQLIKRYMKVVKTLLSFPKRSNTRLINHQSYSFSGNSMSRKPVVIMNNGDNKRRGQLSAPASMRASPANSGILVALECVSPTKIRSESSMEELHAAIQAAIAHCKNSIAIEDKIQSEKMP